MNATTSAMVPEVWKVYQNRPETADTVTLELATDHPKAFAPGQFNMLYVFGVGEVPISISGSSHESVTLFHTVRNVGAVSRALCALQPGQELGLRGPYGSSWPILQSQGKDIIVMAGGLGLAPVRPIIYEILNNRKAYGHVWLLYGCRQPEDILFGHQVREWRSRFDLEVNVTVDKATSDWYGSVGVITNLVKNLALSPENTVAFVCGPEIMMRYSALELVKKGLSEDNIHLSMERNMHCAIGLCGHCQYGPQFVCKEGPIFTYARLKPLLTIREV